jgi:hypothetical protein
MSNTLDAVDATEHSSSTSRLLSYRSSCIPFVEAAIAGFMLDVADLTNAFGPEMIVLAYFGTGCALGFRHAGRAWQCSAPLGVSLYVVHVVAILLGVKPPHVEPNHLAARFTLWFFFVAGAGLALGAVARRALAAFGCFKRKQGPPVRLLPRTIPRTLATILAVALLITFTRWLIFDSSTIYAPGFSQSRFDRIRAGMSSREVEAALGPPLEKVEWDIDGAENWKYSTQVRATSNYSRRWVFIRDGEVTKVVRDFWLD